MNLIERLRAIQAWWGDYSIYKEAADRIEELESQVVQLREAVKNPHRWCDDIEVLRKIEATLTATEPK